MLNDVDELVSKLNSPADWAFVGTAGLTGFIADGAFDLVPLATFTPGVCAAVAAASALTAKRGWEAWRLERERRALVRMYSREVRRLLDSARNRQALQFDLNVAEGMRDVDALRDILSRVRDSQ